MDRFFYANMDKFFNLNVKYGILGFNDWITGINSPKKKRDYIEACFERLDFFLEKSNSFMTEDTLLRLIASVERYYLEYEHADSVLRSRIKKYFHDVLPLLHSPKAKVTLLLYRFNLFPYKLVHTILCLR